MALFAVGCGPDCVAACEDQNACPGAVKSDCAQVCDKAKTLNDLADCEDQYDDLLVCIQDQEDVCKTGVQCESKAEQYQDCVLGYCINHAQDCQ
jgi:hypothetical protein